MSTVTKVGSLWTNCILSRDLDNLNCVLIIEEILLKVEAFAADVNLVKCIVLRKWLLLFITCKLHFLKKMCKYCKAVDISNNFRTVAQRLTGKKHIKFALICIEIGARNGKRIVIAVFSKVLVSYYHFLSKILFICRKAWIPFQLYYAFHFCTNSWNFLSDLGTLQSVIARMDKKLLSQQAVWANSFQLCFERIQHEVEPFEGRYVTYLGYSLLIFEIKFSALCCEWKLKPTIWDRVDQKQSLPDLNMPKKLDSTSHFYRIDWIYASHKPTLDKGFP